MPTTPAVQAVVRTHGTLITNIIVCMILAMKNVLTPNTVRIFA